MVKLSRSSGSPNACKTTSIWLTSKFYARLNKMDWNSLELKRALFVSRFSENVTSENLLINIDEWSVSRHTKSAYSWSLKEDDVKWGAIKFSSSASIITAISSDGWHYSQVHNRSINSGFFEDFVRNLGKFIKLKYRETTPRKIWVLDNVTMHKTKGFRQKLEANFDMVYYLPPYSLQYAPVEHFSPCSRKICDRLQSANELDWTLNKEGV